MGRLGSALTLSTIAYAFKGLSKTLPERFDVRGLPILLEALKEPEAQLAFQASDRPGWKGKEREVPVDLEQGKRIRRGVVTSELSRSLPSPELSAYSSMQSQFGSGRSSGE